ncbi:extracellular solute-binding protein [Herbiconiux moechotypicola]|uniref:ABC transporter substrate-binding protein n=1 Tax=Herbiconiux moechotypicola TaxID=637393 RepID=UPI00217D4C12|nr:extracellular solute-binding protein [Herbiconiux moechotypicola]MCS5731659.1 extracellular solute-binding protein [Herbiconiux moechotypicola]
MAAIAIVLAGCAGEAEPDTPVGEIGGKLTYWIGVDSSNPDAEAVAQRLLADPFIELYPNVDLQLVVQPETGAAQKLQTALAAGQGPDFIETPGSATAIPYAEAGYLANLDAVAEEEGWKDEMLPWALDMGVINGELVAMPTNYETLVLYYNKTLFDENGWQPPTDRASLESLAAQMEAKDILPFTAGNADYAGATEWLVSAYLNQVAGPGKIHDALAGEVSFEDPAFVDAMQMMVDDFNAGWFGGGVKQYFSTTDPQKYAKLVTGEAGMFVSGSWEIQALNQYFGDSDADWDWVALPPLADGIPSDVYPLSVGGTISINAATKNLPAAEAYLKWKFSDTDTQWAAIKEIGALPKPVPFDTSAVPDGIDPRFVAQYSAISDASLAEHVGYVTWTSFGGAAEAFISENQDRMLTGDMSADEFCAGLANAYQKDADAGVVPPLFDTAAR